MPRPIPRAHEPRKPQPKYLSGDDPTTRQRSLDQENSVAKKLSGRRQPGSGCFEFKEGDVITPSHLIECKTTKKGSYAVSLKVINKIEKEAFAQGLKPAVCIRLENDYVTSAQRDWVLIPLNDFKALLGD